MPPPSLRRHRHNLHDMRIILVRPCYPENLGSVARAMQVTGFHRLTLINPAALADPAHPNAVRMAVGSRSILDNTRIVRTLAEALTGCRTVYAATARAKRGAVLTPRQAAEELARNPFPEDCSLLFGSEADGLRRTELKQAGRLIRIPMAGSQPSLNLSHAVMVILYEILTTLYTGVPRDSLNRQ